MLLANAAFSRLQPNSSTIGTPTTAGTACVHAWPPPSDHHALKLQTSPAGSGVKSFVLLVPNVKVC